MFKKSDTETVQKGNEVAGDLAGGNITKNIINNSVAVPTPSLISQLNARYKEEIQKNPQLQAAIDTLRDFLEPRNPVIGLEDKLSQAGWTHDDIEDVLWLKELFAKKLRRHMLAEAAQQILTHLLSLLYVKFQQHIKPLIAVNLPMETIRSALIRDVVTPAFQELEENVLVLEPHEIQGAVYYLTGNCHLRWRRQQ